MKVESIWLADLTPDQQRLLDHPCHTAPPNTTDVLIVGAGLVGLFTAWQLRRRFRGSITVVDTNGLSQGASGHNTGGLFAGQTRHDHPPLFRDWAIEARESYFELSTGDGPLAATGVDFVRSGSLRIDGAWPGDLATYADSENRRGNRCEALVGAALSDCEPALSTSVSEGLFCPDDATFHPLKTAIALATDLIDQGVQLLTHTPVTGFTVAGGSLLDVACGRSRISVGQVVLTTGWSAGELSAQCGYPVPIQPAKGQAIATDPQQLTMQTCVLGDTMVRQLPDGRVVAGGTQEFVGPDLEPTEDGRRQLEQTAGRMLPALAHVEATRTWVGLRPHTPDEMPIVDRVPGTDNVFLAAGHFTKGVLLAPVTGEAIANWLVDGSPGRDLSHLAALRFAATST